MPSRGELEQRVMELLWAADQALTVAEVHAQLSVERELAYTTVMTVLDRLSKKALALRELEGRAWRYRPRAPQEEILAEEIVALLAPLSEETRTQTLQLVVERIGWAAAKPGRPIAGSESGGHGHFG